MQHASKQKTKGFLIFMSHSVLCTDRAEVEATFRLLEEENRNNPHIVNGMMAMDRSMPTKGMMLQIGRVAAMSMGRPLVSARSVHTAS